MLTQAWRIEMLGGLRARRGTQQVTRFRSGVTGALLAHLAYHPETVHRRVTLAGLFWPDAEPADALASLRTALGSLRHQLEPPGSRMGSVLAADREHIQLLPEAFTTDVAEFENLLLAAAQASEGPQSIALLTQAHALYQGDLLPGTDRNLEEAWVDIERDRLRQAFYESLLSLADLVDTQGDASAAIALAQRALKVDAQQEAAHEHLIRLYAAQSKFDAAARQYRKMETILRDTLHIAPSEDLQELYQDIKRRPHKYIRQNARTDAPANLSPASPPDEGTMTQGRAVPLHSAPLPDATRFPLNASLPFSPNPLTSPFSRLAAPLPTCRTQFFGRQQELQQIMQALKPYPAGEQTSPDAEMQSHCVRLLTLSGHGGAGKTRLALEAAHRLREVYAGRVIFVTLADLSDAEEIANSILDALGVPRIARCDPVEQILAVLNGQPALLTLDNFEHLLLSENQTPTAASANAAEFVDILLERAPELRCLVTSRRKLDVRGEQEIVVRALHTPDAPDTPERLLMYPGIKLFVDRAHLANPDFRFHPGNSAAIQTLCQRLEGIPLAIELAAAWARTLSPAQMLTRLDNRLDFLRRDKGPWPARHLSLRAAIDGSYRMLPPNVQRFFMCLSVFRGGWTLEAAQAIVAELAATDSIESHLIEGDSQGDSVIPGDDAMAYLETLSHHSLIRAEEEGGEMRFFLLDTLRAFCLEQLSPLDNAHLSRRHAGWFMRMAEQADANLDGAEQKSWLDRLAREQENLRAALAWCLYDPASRLTGLRLAGALAWFWDVRCYVSEGRRWLTQFLDAAAKEEAANREAANSGEAEEGLSKARGVALSGAGWLALRQDDNEQGRALYAECLHIRQRLQDQRGIGYALNGIGLAARQQGDFSAAYEYFRQALDLRQELGHAADIASSLNNLAIAAGDMGRHEEARDLYTRSLALARKHGNEWGIANALSNLGEVLTRAGEYDEAGRLFAQSLPIKQQLHDDDGIANTLEATAWLKSQQRQSEDATRLLAASEVLRQKISSPLTAASRHRHDRVLAQLREALGKIRFISVWDEGQKLDREQAIAFALQTLRF